MEKFIIQGGVKLQGSIHLCGAKNASYKLMISSLLASGESRLLNVPQISDVEIVRKIITELGGKVRSAGERMLLIDTSSLTTHIIPKKYGKLSRASSLFIAPLLARKKKVIVPLPGGDKIGARPLDRHLEGIKALGASVQQKNNSIEVLAKRLVGTRYRFQKNTHTGTETMILASVLAKGKTILENAALEPEVDDLISFLSGMGANINRRPKRIIEIIGVNKLYPTIHKIMPDRNEAVSYACAALATRGDIIVENARKDHLQAFLDKLVEAGGGFETESFGIRFYYKKQLRATDVITQPHPGFMTDWQQPFVILMTQSEGISIVHETVYEKRFGYVNALKKMGAEIELYNTCLGSLSCRFKNTQYNHSAVVKGPTGLNSAEIDIPDLRAGFSYLIAGVILSA